MLNFERVHAEVLNPLRKSRTGDDAPPQEKLNQLEAELGEYRGAMKLGWTDPATGDFNKASSVLLSNTMKTSDEEPKRKACWEVRAGL